MEFQIIFYKTKTQNPVENFILSLEEDLQLKIIAILKRMRINPFNLGDYSKKLIGYEVLFELRVFGKDKTVRILYTFEKNKIVILLNGFVKKTQKTPLKEIEIALKRLKEYKTGG